MYRLMMANVEPDSWTFGLQQNGEYYEGVVSSLDDRLEEGPSQLGEQGHHLPTQNLQVIVRRPL